MTFARVMSVSLLTALIQAGCRESPLHTPQPSGPVQTSYVGIAELSGPNNVLIVFTEGSDSANTLSGSITYLSQTLVTTELWFDSASDSLHFSYTRDNLTYRAWAQRFAFSMDVHITEPSGISPFQMNLELDGHNMTGLWTGEMSSTALQGQRAATMTMIQTGTVFEGNAQVNFFETWNFDLSSGTTSGNAFELTGTVYGSGSYPAVWQGNYVGFDSISGAWDVGEQSEIDRGEFLFTRSFR